VSEQDNNKARERDEEKERDKEQEQDKSSARDSAAVSAENADDKPAAAEQAPSPQVETVAAPVAAPPPPPAPRAGSSAVAWLALILVLALAAGVGWLVMEYQRRDAALQSLQATAQSEEAEKRSREAEVLSRLTDLEGIVSGREDNVAEVNERLQQQLQRSTGKLQTDLSSLAQSTQQGLASMEARLTRQREELNRYSTSDRGAWLIAEAEYLLRLANQRLIMAGDTVAAQALLKSTDNILMELDDASLHPVRAAVAADLAALRAVPHIDVEGIYLRLAALVEQADQLVIFELPEEEAQPEQVLADDWQSRLQQGYEDALQKLSDYIVIRRRDVPMQALMDPQWEGLVRQNLRMLLEQAQVALLSGNQTLYAQSLKSAQHWVGEFFESDGNAARAMAREINQLMDASVSSSVPDINRSLQALDEARKQHALQGGSE